MTVAVELDARGLLCPMPLVRAARELQRQRAGAIVAVRADDPETLKRLPGWCDDWSAECLGVEWGGGDFRFSVRSVTA